MTNAALWPGHDKLKAVQLAAETRLRPVFVTTAVTVLGHFPLVLVSGAGAEARSSIGIILVAGMLIGTAFRLLVLPSVYIVLATDRNRHRVAEEVPSASVNT